MVLLADGRMWIAADKTFRLKFYRDETMNGDSITKIPEVLRLR